MPSGESAVLKERPKVKKRIKWKSGLLRALLYVVIILFGVTFAFPFFLTLMNSLKPLTASVGLSQIIPSEFHWENYYYAVTLIPFFKYLLNSLIIVAIVVPMCTIINMVIGYAFARLRARGKDVMFVIVLSTMMIPGIVTMIPQYILYNVLGITDTFFIYVLGNIGGGAYNIFLFKQFFSAMPKELEEAAKIDGAGTLQTIFRIFAPAAKPVIIIVAIGALLVIDSAGFHTGIELLHMPLEKLMVYFAMVFCIVLEVVQMRYNKNLAAWQKECWKADPEAQMEKMRAEMLDDAQDDEPAKK